MVPYDKATQSYSKDVDALEDAYANMSNRAANSTWSDKWIGPFFNALGSQVLSEGLGVGLGMLGQGGLSSLLTSGAATAGALPTLEGLGTMATPAIEAAMLALAL